MNVQSVLFVCTGNTCRSPMAEAIWNAMGGNPPARSAGVSAWSGQPASSLAQAVVGQYGGDLRRHRSRDITDVTEEPDLVLTMTRSQAERVKAVKPEWAAKTFVLSEFLGQTGDIPDPVGSDQTMYERVAEQLYQLLTTLKQRLNANDSSDASATTAGSE